METSIQSEKNFSDSEDMDMITDLTTIKVCSDDLVAAFVDLKGWSGARVIVCSAYLPGERDNPTGDLARVVDYAARNNAELLVGCDANAHHTSWGSTDTNSRGPGFEDLDFSVYMAPEGCFAPQPVDGRRPGSHQLPESPPDSGSENPYSPETIPISVPNVLNADYMLVHDQLPTHEILTQNGEYIYEELKSDDVLRSSLNGVVVLNQDLGLDSMYQNRYSQLTELEQGMINPQLVALHDTLTPVYTSLQEPSTKKRKHSQDTNVKCEPAALSPEAVSVPRPAPSVDGSEAGDDAPLQTIRFAPFQQPMWNALYDCNLKPLQTLTYVVGADKGFNFSQIDEAFVCQKKNHFQVTCQIQVQGDPHYVKCNEGFKKINNFCLHFYGVKAEDPSQEVRVEQSQSDRTKKPFHPVPVEIRREGAKVTVGRLHFAETTNNNMRKKGRPNPDQRHFQLVVALRAHTAHTDFMVAAHASDRIIVRASNPGQFESDCPEGWWQRGVSENSVHFNGRVGINTDRPDESCVVNGNLKVMGRILHPSDARAKHNIEELDTAQQLKNVQSIRVVKFNYDPSFAEHSGLVGYDPLGPSPALDTGVIAQEVRRVLPEAVREAGDVALPNGDTIHKFLVVNKDRIFMENLGAVKELCKVTGHLESRIDQLERINKKLCGLQRRDSSRSSVSNDSRYSAVSNSSKSHGDNVSIDQIRDIARNIKKHECCHKLSHHSPKFTRKQCKNCHTTSKLGKYYNYNKTSVRYHSNKTEDEKKLDNPTYIDTESPSSKEDMKRKDTCLWMRDDFSYGNTKLGFCCRRKDYSDASSELISNKLLQIIITILIFIMAVCLVVMSALYFREHQELITMKEIRMHEKFSTFAHYGKPNGVTVHRTPPDQNQIQNSKPSQHAPAKKTAKEKGPHKTTAEYVTTHTEPPPPHVPSSTLPNKNYASNFIINTVQTTPPPLSEQTISLPRIADVIGKGCNYALNNNNELDPECQSSCGGLDTPQTFESQEPLERSKPDKELNETFTRPLEPLQKDKQPIIPIIPEKNNSEVFKNDNDSFKISEGTEDSYSNLLDGDKTNGTDNISRMKREVRQKRETYEISSEEMVLTDQSKELAGARECDTVYFGIASQTIVNDSLFSDTVCANTAQNFTYTVPLSHCLNIKNIDITFKSTKLKDFRLCELHCANNDPSKSCRGVEMSKPIPTVDTYTFKISLEKWPLDCNIDRIMKIRAVYTAGKLHYSARDLCYNTLESFVEYNIRIYRHCHN